jgi:hypothetical protein
LDPRGVHTRFTNCSQPFTTVFAKRVGGVRDGSYIYRVRLIDKIKIEVMTKKKFQQIDTKAYFDFKTMSTDLKMSKLTPDLIDQLKKQLDTIIKK